MTLAWDRTATLPLSHGELIGALTEVVGLLLRASHLPAFEPSQLTLWVQGSNSDQIAYVRQLAAEMDVSGEWVGENAFRAWRQYGPLQVVVSTAFQPEPDAQTTLTMPAVDESAMPEIECADCRGTGEQRDGSTCFDCLGKGRIAAPAGQPRHAAGAQAW